MMAGDVSATIVGDQLRIIGDGGHNGISISGVWGSYLVVNGTELNGRTTINGGSARYFSMSSIKHISISTGDGDDQVKVQNLTSGAT